MIMCDFIPEFKDGSILGNLINLMQDTIRSKYTNYLTISRDIENSLWQDSTPLKKKKNSWRNRNKRNTYVMGIYIIQC